jgi:hypothetical protein
MIMRGWQVVRAHWSIHIPVSHFAYQARGSFFYASSRKKYISCIFMCLELRKFMVWVNQNAHPPVSLHWLGIFFIVTRGIGPKPLRDTKRYRWFLSCIWLNCYLK